jgi:hypothetical protein
MFCRKRNHLILSKIVMAALVAAIHFPEADGLS